MPNVFIYRALVLGVSVAAGLLRTLADPRDVAGRPDTAVHAPPWTGVFAPPGEIDVEGRPLPRASAFQWAEYFSRSTDLVFVGRVRSCQRDSMTRVPGAEVLMTLRIERVLRGYLRDSLVSFSSRTFFAARMIQPGTQVLAWASRRLDLAQGANEHGFFIIGRGGVFLRDGGASEGDLLAMSSGELRLQDLPEQRLQRTDIRQALRGSTALAVVRLARIQGTSLNVPWRCDSARWVLGTAKQLPRYVRFADPDNGVFPGFEYALPVPTDYSGDTLVVNASARVLRITAGQMPALGISVDELPTVLRYDSHGGIEVIEPAWVHR